MIQQQSQQASILVVDDNPLIVNVLQSLFGSQGYQVHTAGNGQEAVDLLQGQGVDLIVCDVMMPVMDGYELHTKVREQSDLAHIPFVFLTALGDGVEVNRGLETGVDDYVVKPFDPADLLALVKGKLVRSHTLKQHTEQRYDSYRKRVVHTLSHEFRTPLVAINTGTELLLDQFGALEQPKVKNVLEAIRRGGERLERLVTDFMVLQQIEGGVARKLFDTRRKTRTAAEVLKDFHDSRRSWFQEEKISCTLHDNSGAALIEIYEPQVHDMLDRLCHNAIKFCSGDSPSLLWSGISIKEMAPSTRRKGTSFFFGLHRLGCGAVFRDQRNPILIRILLHSKVRATR